MFFAGALASSAMILPGISGSYILVILGKYEYMLETLTQWLDLLPTALQTRNIALLFQQELVTIGVFIA